MDEGRSGDGEAGSRLGSSGKESEIERRRRQRREYMREYRQRESEAQRMRRLAKQREYDKARRAKDRETRNLKQPEWKKMEAVRDVRSGLKAIPQSVKDSARERLQRSLGPSELEECVCAVCDRLQKAVDCQQVNTCDVSFLRKLKSSLGDIDKTLRPGLVSYYDCGFASAQLRGMLLSKDGVVVCEESGWWKLTICSDCAYYVSRRQMPKFAIVNGFCIGELPTRLQCMTSPERFLTQPVSVVAFTRVMRGGKHRCIRSHCMAFDATPCPPACLLPRSLNAERAYRVVLAGEMTELQVDKIRKMHLIRQQVVKDALEFYKKENQLFHGVEVDENAFVDNADAWSDRNNELFIVAEERPAGGIDRDGEGIEGSRDDCRATSAEEELEVLERSVGFVAADIPAEASRAKVVVEVTGNADTERRFLVRHSSKFATDSSGALYGKMFPHLFPFGRGHPGDNRKHPVSQEECIKHYLLLSSRRFAEDETFSFVAFDRLSLEKMYLQTSLRCRRSPNIFAGFEELSEAELADALEANEKRRQGRTSSRDSSALASRFLKSVEVSSSAVWGSAAERRYYRQQAFAYQGRYGQPTLFVTLTPNSDNSFVTVNYSGNSSTGSLWDSWLSRLPSRIETRKATMGDDAASARVFMRQMDAFVVDVLGINPITHEKLPLKGLLGEVRAYFGMIETQGRGTLHGHFLVWLSGCPPNSEIFESVVSCDKERFLSDVADYGESIMTNELPISLSGGNCEICGESFANLAPLPIPAEARGNVLAPFTGRRIPTHIREPALVKCGRCGAEFSSQHVLRSVMLKHWSVDWPPGMSPLTPSEIVAQAKKEVMCRNSLVEAENVVYERESIRSSASANVADNNGSGELRERSEMELDRLHCSNEAQALYTRLDDDPFFNSDILRTLAMMPPSEDDERISIQSKLFMVSALAIRFNQHWWSHTASCFKESKMTGSSEICRYTFPRERVDQSYVDDTGFHARRLLGYEFMNGFNPTIMETFRCNHDVQLLVGGSGATDRIYYCCKYVAKPQRQHDSVTATALVAFKRREEREEQERQDGSRPEGIVIARRRVGSMAFNITNRQEIAGPLAVLYLLHGSCCYQSHECCQLPLRDIIKQLKGEDEFSCRLVQRTGLESGEGRNTFRAVSVLDDYLYRPAFCENASLYEFAARSFRRLKQSGTNPDLFYIRGHPLQDTHCVGMHRFESVPMITGFQIPQWKEDAPLTKREQYASAVLVLFRPFRELSDILGGAPNTSEGWIDAYSGWKDNRPDIAKEIMSNLNDYYVGKEIADKSGDFCMPGQVSQSDYGSDSSEEDGMFAGDTGVEAFSADNNVCAADIDNLFGDVDLGGTDTLVLGSNGLDPAFCPTLSQPADVLMPTIERCLEYNMFEGTLAFVANQNSGGTDTSSGNSRDRQLPELQTVRSWVAENGLAVDMLRQWVASPDTDSMLHSGGQRTVERNTEVVELISEALSADYRSWEPIADASIPQGDIPPYAPLKHISQAYTLNEKQHVAFCKVGEALLQRWKVKESAEIASPRMLHEQQLRMFLGGEGGTGKSRVIEAVEALCCSWGRRTSIIKTALTGKATTIIGGRTLASFLLVLERGLSSVDLEDLDIVIVDEVSMMKKSELAKLDRLLRKQKKMMEVPFGGVHILLTGDFLQLPPVGAEPIYTDPTKAAKCTPVDITAFEIWKTFQTVVILEESVRFRSDPEWGEGCRAARRGVWTKAFIEIINSRVVPETPNALSDLNIREVTGQQCIFASPENTTRQSINNEFVVRAAANLRGDNYPIRVVANFKGALQFLSRQEVDMVMNLPDSKFGRLAPFMDLIPGMPIQITQNVRTSKGVANGTLGVLVDVMFDATTRFRTIRDETTGMLVSLPSQPPVLAFVQIARGAGAVPISERMDPDIFPLFYTTEAYSKCKIKLAPAPDGTPRSLEVKIQQFPFVCSVGSTAYKVQGETLNALVVLDWKSSVSFANKPQQNYLLVSRVTSRHALLAMKTFTQEIADWSKPPQDALDEEDRLLAMSEQTIRDFVF